MNLHSFRSRFRLVGLTLSSCGILCAQSNAESTLIFEQKILPVFEKNCVKCHSGSAAQGGLDVRTRASLLRGEDPRERRSSSGIPGKSLLYQRVASGQMPLAAKALTPAETGLIKQWIDQGAKAENPEATTAAIGTSARDRSHWAFQSPIRPKTPAVNMRIACVSRSTLFFWPNWRSGT